MAAAALCPALASCDPAHDVTAPTTPEGGAVLQLFWIFLGVGAVVWVLVVVALFLALVRRRPARPDPLARDPAYERRAGIVVVSLAGATGIIVIVLSVLSFGVQADIFRGSAEEGLVITLTGHQWWWEATYESPQPDQIFDTANELHLPVGAPVSIRLDSADVIHSFWVPSLLGKLDLIPGRKNVIRFTPEKAGVYRGQCAEFCGVQHAHMGLEVFVDEPEAFAAWRQGQLSSAVPPQTGSQRRGLRVFEGGPCAACHTIRGTSAGGAVGPDLTHLMSRTSIAANSLPLTRGALAAWIVDAQGIKPGARMPDIALAAGDLNALLDYLEQLR